MAAGGGHADRRRRRASAPDRTHTRNDPDRTHTPTAPAPSVAGDPPAPPSTAGAGIVAVVVPHTHWDREWYAPFETMRFHLVRFLDELLDVLEATPDLVFVLDGQAVMLEDYLEVRPRQRERLAALVTAGRLRPGPWYVQPDEFHVSGEALVRNLLIGCRVAGAFGWVMREGYLPDTFGHVHQLPQILQGFGIATFYAMRGFGADAQAAGDEFWWEAPDGTRVRATWLRESYSNAGVLHGDPDRMALAHGTLVRYGTLRELLVRLAARSHSGVLLLLNGGDHMRVQDGVPDMVRRLDAGVEAAVRLGGLEDVHALAARRPAPTAVLRGELRHGLRHDVFAGIGSTRTPLKAHGDRVEAKIALAERLDTMATLMGGRPSADAVHHLWRELIKNHAHDSICGCSIDAVHDEMATRFAKLGQLATAITDDALAHIATAAAGTVGATPAAAATPAGAAVRAGAEVPVVVVNASGFARGGAVTVDVVSDAGAPLGERRFGWHGEHRIDWGEHRLVDEHGRDVPVTVTPNDGITVADVLDRRKEVRSDRLRFVARDVPAFGVRRYRLVPGPARPGAAGADPATPDLHAPPSVADDHLRATLRPDGTVSLTHLATGRTFHGLLELRDDGDAGDEYGFGPLPGDHPLSSRDAAWRTGHSSDGGLAAGTTLRLPVGLRPDRSGRSDDMVDVGIAYTLHLDPGTGCADIRVTVDNRARDHRLRLRVAGGVDTAETLAESAFGIVRRPAAAPGDVAHWHERPSGVGALRRFVALADDGGGLQVLAEGLREYALTAGGDLDLTLLRAVGWLSRTDHPLRGHKIGPQLPTPGAQCLGRQTFRIALRPFGPGAGHGDLYRAAERFSVPLRAHAVQGGRRATARPAAALGLEVTPAAAVLSAVKPAEDGNGVIMRVFNGDQRAHVATLSTAVAITGAWACDLEERRRERLAPAADGALRVALAPAAIATVHLDVPAAPTAPTAPTAAGRHAASTEQEAT